MEGVSKGDKIPERPSAEGFSLSSRAKSHCRSTCSVKKPWRAFLRTSYPRSRSANSAKFRFAQLARSSKFRFAPLTCGHNLKSRSAPQRRDFPCPHESSCTSYNLLGRVSLAPLHLLAATDLPQHPPLAAEVVVGPQGDGPVGGVQGEQLPVPQALDVPLAV